MNRDVKFRAWDKVHKNVKEVASINWVEERVQLLIKVGNIKTTCWRDFSQVKLMQFAGFKEKNYKEIYKGHIVEINNHKYEIKFEIGSFMLVRCSDETEMYEQFSECWNDDVYPLSKYYWNNDEEDNILSDCEIVGNIYETLT